MIPPPPPVGAPSIGNIEFTPIEKTVEEGINYFKKFGTLGEYTHLKIKN